MPTLLPRFQIHQPSTVAEACQMLAEFGEDGHAYAGGTELLLAMKQGGVRFEHLVDLKTVAGLDRVEQPSGGLRIGALATHLTLERSPTVREVLPILADVEHQVANVRVRAAGTLGGNLCFGEPHSDPATLLLCLDARLLLAGPAGEREVMLPEFVVGPYETALGDGEILKSIMISSPGPRQRAAYVKFQLREYPMLGLALVLDVDVAAEGIREARLAVGSASPTPRRSTAAEALLVGDLRSVAGALDSAADVLADEAELMDDLDGSADYKRHLIHVSLRRLFQRCTNQA